MTKIKENYEVVVVGGGAAGLSAALLLGRCLRDVLVCDDGRQRNLPAEHLKGYLTRDYTMPADFLEAARGDLKRYETVQYYPGRVIAIKRQDDGFEVRLENESVAHAEKVILATGKKDELPEVAGLKERFGKSVFICPYCDGWDFRQRSLAVYAQGEKAVEMARALSAWSDKITVLTDGHDRISEQQAAWLRKAKFNLNEEKLSRLDGPELRLEKIILADGTAVDAEALFLDLPADQKSPLALQLQCKFDDSYNIVTKEHQSTDVPGLYVAGNMSGDVQLVIVAAAEGARAAAAANKALTREKIERVVS